MQLRDYQLRALERVRASIRSGNKRIVLVAPTGSGKTVMASEMIRLAESRGTRSVFIAHRKELIDQSHEKLKAFGVNAGVIMGADHRTDSWMNTQVCSIQTLARRVDKLPGADLVIVDECHHALSGSYQSVLEKWPDAIVVGLTATPWRSDKLGLREMFDDSVLAATPRELINSGALVDFEAFAYDAPDLHSVDVVAGDYNQGQLELACNTNVLVGSVVKEYIQHATGRSAIVFPVSLAHSEALCRSFNEHGVVAKHVDCYMSKTEREQALEDFKDGKITVVSSVGVLSEGFDAPRADVCILARPTKSLALHVQMCGRVLRPFDGKAIALIHDHAGNLLRHGMPDDDRDYSLTPTPKAVLARKTCAQCGYLAVQWKNGRCPKCGFLNQLVVEVSPSTDDEPKEREDTHIVVSGTRISIDRIRELRSLQEANKYTVRSDDELALGLAATRDQKIGEWLRLDKVRQQKNLQPGFVSHQFRSTFGHWPRFSEDELAGKEAATRSFLPYRRK